MMRVLVWIALYFGSAFGNYGKYLLQPRIVVQYMPEPENYPPPQHPTKKYTATTTEPPTTTAQNSEPMPELAPLDEDKVKEFFGRYCKFFNDKDHDSLLGLYAEDVVYIQTGSDILDKKKLDEKLAKDLEPDDVPPCDESIDVLSGDYYFPYFIAHYYETDSYGIRVAHQVFTDVLRLNDKGDYEIVSENVFDLVVKQNAPEEKPSQPYGYQTPTQASPEEKPPKPYGYQTQASPEEKPPQPYGYQTQTQASPEEKPPQPYGYQTQASPEEKPSQPYGYQTQTQASPEEKTPQPYGYQPQASPEEKPSPPYGHETKTQDSPKKKYEQPKQYKPTPVQKPPESMYKPQYLPSHPEEKPIEKTYPPPMSPKYKAPEASNPPKVYHYNN